MSHEPFLSEMGGMVREYTDSLVGHIVRTHMQSPTDPRLLSFLTPIYESPQDAAPKLVFSDWLQERESEFGKLWVVWRWIGEWNKCPQHIGMEEAVPFLLPAKIRGGKCFQWVKRGHGTDRADSFVIESDLFAHLLPASPWRRKRGVCRTIDEAFDDLVRAMRKLRTE